MKRKLDVQQLKIGMYVSELDRPWRETPFMFQGFEIRSEDEIRELQRHCQHVYIETAEIYQTPPPRTPAERAVARVAVNHKKVERDLLIKVESQPLLQPVYHDRTTLEEEIQAVEETHRATRALVYTVMEDVRLGKNINTLGARKIVGELAESVIRNPDALTCFTQLKKKDEYTALHSLRVCILALAFGRHLGLERDELNLLGLGALLHDIGKMKVPNEILNKPGALSDYEYALMKSHVPRGVEILDKTPGIPRPAIEVARCHHERYSGSGYIGGLKGDQIGLFGMIGGIVDCYDAISSDRAYHAGMSAHAALKKMYEWRNRDFHPALVEQFIQCMGIYPIGSVVELNTGEIGVVVAMNRVRRLKPRVALVLRADFSPLPGATTVDLMEYMTRDGHPCEIERVLEPGIYGINPVNYMPVTATA
ncbi:MAG TPA: HD-GYP domain-containing protein [Candidatus Methylomirabilis sp.]|nr:HD-GYP domain-containing protein [Candidatus Methylomirabilis sp.]